MIAAVTDLCRPITGAHRTWLAPDGSRQGAGRHAATGHGRSPRPCRALRRADDVLAAGEGIETMLSLRFALPAMPMAAALSANHLAALLLPPTLRRLYIARDADAAGDMALAALTERAEAAGIEALALSPRIGDFNEDLQSIRPRRAAGGAAHPTRAAGCPAIHGSGNGHGDVTDCGSGLLWPIRRGLLRHRAVRHLKPPLSSGGDRREEPIFPDAAPRPNDCSGQIAPLLSLGLHMFRPSYASASATLVSISTASGVEASRASRSDF